MGRTTMRVMTRLVLLEDGFDEGFCNRSWCGTVTSDESGSEERGRTYVCTITGEVSFCFFQGRTKIHVWPKTVSQGRRTPLFEAAR